MAMIVIATVLRPGDAPWINDEPIMMETAIRYNATRSDLYGVWLPVTPAPFGLMGTRGARYGPLPIWIDQLFLAFTHNLVVMMACRAAVCSAVTAIALLWLSRTLGLSPWLAVATMLSPWLWFYSRQLWDNSLCVPLSALFLAAYADFFAIRRRWSLQLCTLCAMCLLLTHFMSVALLVPVALHLSITRFRTLWWFKWGVAAIIVIVAGVSWPYWYFLVEHYHGKTPGGSSPWLGWFYPLLGAHHLTAAGLDNILGEGWQYTLPVAVRSILLAAQWFSLAAYGAVWTGMLLALIRGTRVFVPRLRSTTMDHLCLVALAIWIGQSILNGLEHIDEGPHYFNATWIVYALFAWLSIDFLGRRFVAARALMPVYGVSLLTVAAIVAIKLHHDGGTRSANYGTALADQLQAAHRIDEFSPDSPRQIDLPQWSAHPLGLATLLELLPPPNGPHPTRLLLIRYRDAFANDARIKVTAGAP
jgi:hypothetical protein